MYMELNFFLGDMGVFFVKRLYKLRIFTNVIEFSLVCILIIFLKEKENNLKYVF